MLGSKRQLTITQATLSIKLITKYFNKLAVILLLLILSVACSIGSAERKVNCDTAESENFYLYITDATQTISGNSRKDRGSFRVYQVNDK